LNSYPIDPALAGESRHPSSPNRAILLALTSFEFQGVSKYLEELIACIDAPELNDLQITYGDFDTAQLTQSITRTLRLPVECPDEARVYIIDSSRVLLSSQTPHSGHFLT
jgi:hypothetical protein